MELEVVALIIPAFVAGILTFIAPCTLPLLPVFLSFISGVSLKDLGRSNEPVSREIKLKIIKNALLYILGFSSVFISFGVLAGALGASLWPFRQTLTKVGGALVIVFGLYLIGILKLPLFLQNSGVN